MASTDITTSSDQLETEKPAQIIQIISAAKRAGKGGRKKAKNSVTSAPAAAEQSAASVRRDDKMSTSPETNTFNEQMESSQKYSSEKLFV